ncbi:MAG: hypothetical protein RR061_07545 [Muribaculaceae bacterium]
MKRDLKLREERDRELVRIYKEQLVFHFQHDEKLLRANVIKDVIKNGKPRYHVCFEYALRVLSLIKRNGDVPARMSIRRMMWYEILGHVDGLMQHHENYSLSDALAIVLRERRASQFFITTKYANKIIYEALHYNRLNRCA